MRRLVRRVSTPTRARRWPGQAGIPAAALFLLVALAPVLAHAQESDSVVVTWTAAGDDGGVGTAAAYDLRISETQINSSNFDAALRVPGVPTPAPAGTKQRVTVLGLTHGTTYFFAIRSVDDAGNWSAISNVLRWNWIRDTSPPATPQGVTAQKEASQVRVAWAAGADADLRGYLVYRATSGSGPWTALTTSPITATEYVDSDVPTGAGMVWYQVSAVDATGNESAKSAPLAATAPPTTAAATQATIEPPYPNPSHGSDPVQIPVVIPDGASGNVVIDVVNAGGVRVRRIERSLASGHQEITWDGKNDAGRVVAPGVYRAWLIAGDTRTSIRLLRAP